MPTELLKEKAKQIESRIQTAIANEELRVEKYAAMQKDIDNTLDTISLLLDMNIKQELRIKELCALLREHKKEVDSAREEIAHLKERNEKKDKALRSTTRLSTSLQMKNGQLVEKLERVKLERDSSEEKLGVKKKVQTDTSLDSVPLSRSQSVTALSPVVNDNGRTNSLRQLRFSRKRSDSTATEPKNEKLERRKSLSVIPSGTSSLDRHDKEFSSLVRLSLSELDSKIFASEKTKQTIHDLKNSHKSLTIQCTRLIVDFSEKETLKLNFFFTDPGQENKKSNHIIHSLDVNDQWLLRLWLLQFQFHTKFPGNVSLIQPPAQFVNPCVPLHH